MPDRRDLRHAAAGIGPQVAAHPATQAMFAFDMGWQYVHQDEKSPWRRLEFGPLVARYQAERQEPIGSSFAT
jgi:hypothetical protein